MIWLFYQTLLHTHHDDGGVGLWIHHWMEEMGAGEALSEFAAHLVIDCFEIFLLLIVVMTGVFFLQSFINFNKLKAKLQTLHNFWAYLLAVVLGMLSPFCSCSIVPLLMGLISVGVPLSVCLCMMTSASLLNLTAITTIYTVLGPKFFLQYILCSAVLIGVPSLVLGRISFKDPAVSYMIPQEHHHHEGCCCEEHQHDMECGGHSRTMPFLPRVGHSICNALHILKDTWFYILLGVALSAAIASFFPLESIASFVNSNHILSVTTVTLIGLPIHSDLFSILPVLILLREISPAAAMTFTLSTMVISIPGIILMCRVLKSRVVAIYSGLLVALTLLIGFVLVML